MRKILFCLLTLALTACDDDDASSDIITDASSIDGSVIPNEDASVSQDATPDSTPDATSEDATPDATSEDATPEDATPEDATLEDATPEDATLEDATPEDATPEDASIDATPEDATPEDATPEDATPEDATLEDATPEDATTGEDAAIVDLERCGDDHLDIDEICDDGNDNENDHCTAQCSKRWLSLCHNMNCSRTQVSRAYGDEIKESIEVTGQDFVVSGQNFAKDFNDRWMGRDVCQAFDAHGSENKPEAFFKVNLQANQVLFLTEEKGLPLHATFYESLEQMANASDCFINRTLNQKADDRIVYYGGEGKLVYVVLEGILNRQEDSPYRIHFQIYDQRCGDGLIRGTEQCDDQNEEIGDGCDRCHLESGYDVITEGARTHVEAHPLLSGDGLSCQTKGVIDDHYRLSSYDYSHLITEANSWSSPNSYSICGLPGHISALYYEIAVLADDEIVVTTDELNLTVSFVSDVCNNSQALACGRDVTDRAVYRSNSAQTVGIVIQTGNVPTLCTQFDQANCNGAIQISKRQAVCGDGILNEGEGCDDANTDDGDGCSAECQPEDGFFCTAPTSTHASLCTWTLGDSCIYPIEIDQFPYVFSGDRFSYKFHDFWSHQTCYMVENYPEYSSEAIFKIHMLPGETLFYQKQDVYADNGFSIRLYDHCTPCTATYEEPIDWQFEDDLYTFTAQDEMDLFLTFEGWEQDRYHLWIDKSFDRCGDGYIEAGEDCDDGNIEDGDGCSSLCTIETGFSCFMGAEPVGGANLCLTEEAFDRCFESIEIDDLPSVFDAQIDTHRPGLIQVARGDQICSYSPYDQPFNFTFSLEAGQTLLVTSETSAEFSFELTQPDGTPWSTLPTGSPYSTAFHVQATGEAYLSAIYGSSDWIDHLRFTFSISDPGCGDGVISDDETCDDGNRIAGDGCDAACQQEPGAFCITQSGFYPESNCAPYPGAAFHHPITITEDGVYETPGASPASLYNFEETYYACPLNDLFGPEAHFVIEFDEASSVTLEATGLDGQDVALYILETTNTATPYPVCDQHRAFYGDAHGAGQTPETITLYSPTSAPRVEPVIHAVIDSTSPNDSGRYRLRAIYHR